jgi:hypothetical protein
MKKFGILLISQALLLPAFLHGQLLIESIEPSSGPVGTLVELSIRGIDPAKDYQVLLGDTPVTVGNRNESGLGFRVPDGSDSARVVVQSDEQTVVSGTRLQSPKQFR